MLYNLERMRKSESYNSEIDPSKFAQISQHYNTTGTVGDQVNVLVSPDILMCNIEVS